MIKLLVICFCFCAFLLLNHCAAGALFEATNHISITRELGAYLSRGQSFEKFLGWTNEKQKIAEAILTIVPGRKDSLLDVGAGNGAITKLLEPHFNHITAVEPGTTVFESLKTKCALSNNTLINEPFEKVYLQEKFDIIVASHVIAFFTNPLRELLRIRSLLKENGKFLLIDNTRESEFVKFYYKYSTDILGTTPTNPTLLDYDAILEKIFNVKKVFFTATISIPSVDEAISIFDFIYDVEFSKIPECAILKVREHLQRDYGNGPVTINLQEVMYVCSK